jgi:asparagine synthase (glutamine-hydrolysing)
MFLLSKKVRENNIKVVITGEGADEMLAGYNIFKEAKIRRFWAKEPQSTARPKLLTKLYPYLSGLKNSPDVALKMFFGYKLKDTQDPVYSHLLRWHNTSRLRSFFADDLAKSVQNYIPSQDIYETLPANFDKWSDLAKSQYLESAIFMSGYLLSSQGDRMAMGNSVEGRYPFLDYRVIEFCNQLPDNQKLNSLNEKFILKKLSQERIPPSITARAKQPYRAPIASMLNAKNVKDYFDELLSTDSINSTGVFNSEKVNALIRNIKRQESASEVDQMAIAGILSTQLLHKNFISKKIEGNIDGLTNYRLIDDSE